MNPTPATSPTDHFDRVRAHRAHMALVPLAVQTISERLIDFNGQALADNAPPRDGILCGEVRVLLKEIERLQALVKQQQKDAAEAEREFSREARDIAAEARWEARQEASGDY